MTTRGSSTPVLDRQLQRVIKGPSPGLNPLGQPLPSTSDTEVTVWCSRRDYRGRDQLNIGPGQHFELSDSRFVVRSEGPAWAVNDTFTFEGDTFVVRGVNELQGRHGFLELLARS